LTSGTASDGTGTGHLADIQNLTGGAASDVLSGNAGDNSLAGGGGNDTLKGNGGQDSLLGGAGNDLLIGGPGDDHLEGGDGQDTASYAYASGAVAVNLSTGKASGADGSDTLANVENLVGGAFNDTLTGDAGSNNLSGGAGDDKISGGLGSDVLIGGAGADTFVFGTVAGGADTVLDFTPGTDRLQFQDGAAGFGIGNRDHVIDNATTANASGAFSNTAELVIFTKNVADILNATSAAAAIGSASAAYAIGDSRLFVVDDGTDSAVYWFKAADANAKVAPAELALVGTLQGVDQATPADFAFA
jgi:Ca2+-binding RTX toxin-like protein